MNINAPQSIFLALFFCLLLALQVVAQSEEIAPNANLETQGIPRVPASLAPQVKRYTGAYGLPLAGWNNTKREVLLKGISSASWVSRLTAPGATPQTWLYWQEPNFYDFYFQPQGKYLVYNRDVAGNEAFQLYLYDIEKRASTLLTDSKTRSTEPVWSNAGKQVIYSSSPSGNNGVNLNLIDPFAPKSNRILVSSMGNYLKVYDWSPDDRYAVYGEFISNTISQLWMIEVGTAKPQLLSPSNVADYYSEPQFSADGKGLYVITDREADMRRLAYLDLATRKFTYLSDVNWGVEEFQRSPDGSTLAFVSNEAGLSHLYVFDIASNKKKVIRDLPAGIISDLKWHQNSVDLAFNYKSSRTPNDVYSVNVSNGKVERWASSTSAGVPSEKLAVPSAFQWQSFDGKTISGFLSRPPGLFTGKRPVIIDLHGGPTEQYRPAYAYEENYLMNELGIVKIYHNILFTDIAFFADEKEGI